jgi:putative transposase
MPHTRLIYHYEFGTKGRAPFINKALRSDLHSYMGGIIRNLKGIPIEINGIEDHVHVLAGVPPTIDVSTFCEKAEGQLLFMGR